MCTYAEKWSNANFNVIMLTLYVNFFFLILDGAVLPMITEPCHKQSKQNVNAFTLISIQDTSIASDAFQCRHRTYMPILLIPIQTSAFGGFTEIKRYRR